MSVPLLGTQHSDAWFQENQREWIGKSVVAQFATGGYFSGVCIELGLVDTGGGAKLRMVLENEDMYAAIWPVDVPVLMVKK